VIADRIGLGEAGDHNPLTSDHGNLEDCSTRSHTHNLVPSFIWGPASESPSGLIEAITGATPAVLEWLERERWDLYGNGLNWVSELFHRKQKASRALTCRAAP